VTTPAGVPNLPIGALTVETLGQRLQDQSATAMRNRAGEQMPAIFGASTGGNILSDLSPFGILTKIWAEINSRIATADPVDIQGPEDIPPLLLDFIESLPVVGQFVQLLEALAGTYDGEDPTLLAIQDLLEPIRLIVGTIGQGVADFLKWIWDNFGPAVDSFLKPVIEFLSWLWDLFGDAVESVLQPILTFLHWVFVGLPAGNPPPSTGNAFADSVLQPLFSFLAWVWDLFGDAVESVLQPIFTWLGWLWRLFANITPNPAPTGPGANILVPLFTWLDDLWDKLGATVLAAFNNLINAISGLIPLPTLQSLIEKISVALTGIINPQSFVDMLVKIIEYFKSLFITGSITDFTKNIPIIGPLVSAITGLTEADGVALDFGTVDRFFRELEQKATVSKDSLTEIGNKILGGILSIGMLNTSEPNLLSQGDFATAVTVESAGGWSWDNTVSATSTGGALRATATGSLQQIYSKQSIKTATNDKIKVSASVLTSGFTSGSMVLSIIPWIGTVQQTTHVVSTRTSAASTFQPMTGSTIVIGGTAGAGEISLPAGVTSIQVRLAVNANSGAKVWFDDIAVRKTGLVEQSWVDKLPETWAGAWNAVFGSGGAGKIWSDFISALGTVNYYAGQGFANAGTANGNITTMIDGIGQAVFGDAGYATLSKTVKQSIRTLVSTLFGLPYVAPELSGDVLPPIDGTTITGEIPVGAVPDLPADKINSGTINVDYLPTGDIGAKINPGSGSGAVITRLSTTAYKATPSRNQVGNDFYDTAEVSPSADVQIVMSGSQYTGAFKALTAGWYEVIIGYGLKRIVSNGYSMAPLLYKGSSLASLTPYKVGSEAWATSGAWTRYCQGVFTVYLNVNDYVRAGYDAAYGNITDPNDAIIKADNTGVENYFSIALLNRSYV